MGEKIYLRPDSMEETVSLFLSDYRAKNVENMAIVWTTEDDKKEFKYNFMATESCFKILGLLMFVWKRVMDFIELEQREGGA